MKSQTIFPLRLLTSIGIPVLPGLPFHGHHQFQQYIYTDTPHPSSPRRCQHEHEHEEAQVEVDYFIPQLTTTQSKLRLGFRIFELLKAKPVEEVLRLVEPEIKYNLQDTKEKVYGRIVEYLEVEPYPTTGG